MKAAIVAAWRFVASASLVDKYGENSENVAGSCRCVGFNSCWRDHGSLEETYS